jgi:hypothetical protein
MADQPEQSSPPPQEQNHEGAKKAGSAEKYGETTGTPKQLFP